MVKTAVLPKRTCCVSKSKCKRCPLRMLKEGTLPEGYTVKKRKLVKLDGAPPLRDEVAAKGKKARKKAKKKAKQLVAA